MKLEEQYTVPTTDKTLDLGMLVYCNQLKCLCIISKKKYHKDGKC